ncbi:hypothetical protein [uncultured Pontibacter sp.]|uniref:hypothetical protein n=1 Tax=uncultured Pontibacter sp. TaxID=453356 RepID=UPI00261D12A8|nr:hypothetical protein [uncultured Pontibacter sp.]
MLKEVKNVFGRTFYRVEFNKPLNIIVAEWYGTASQQDLGKALIAGLEMHEHTHCAYRLNDNTNFSGPWAESVAWLEQVWLPRAYEAGIRYLAHVARPNSFGETAGEVMMMGKIGATIEVRIFQDKAGALNWLKAKQETSQRPAK